jgi:hypothetical protein
LINHRLQKLNLHRLLIAQKRGGVLLKKPPHQILRHLRLEAQIVDVLVVRAQVALSR